jgi:glycosyltransferase involved in cell wall biosynthesis
MSLSASASRVASRIGAPSAVAAWLPDTPRRADSNEESRSLVVSMLTTVIVPFHRNVAMLRRVLAPFRDRAATTELLVAGDGPTEDWVPVADEVGAARIHWAVAQGPAVARNRAASVARGRYLLFVDGDVIAEPGVVARVEAFFAARPEMAAVFGAYDEAPEAPAFISQYRNLQHRYVHRVHTGDARTFWAGLGAVRAEAFLGVGGYDERFRRPSVEDIDLGYRLTAAGHRIAIDPDLNGKHLKRWTFLSSLVSDVRDRGVPWTQLIQRYGGLTTDLNLAWTLRLSVACAYLAVASLALGLLDARAWLVTVAAFVALVWLNVDYYAYFNRVRGPWFATRVVGAHFVHHLCNGVSFVVGNVLYWAQKRFGLVTAWTLPQQAVSAVPIRRWHPDEASHV